MSEETYTDYDEGYVETDDVAADEVHPAAPTDVASLISQGLTDLGALKEECAAAESRAEQALADVSAAMEQYKQRAATAVTEARAEATAIVEQARRETNEKVLAVKSAADAELAQVRAELGSDADAAAAEASEVRERYHALIQQLIDTGWATSGALSSMGHVVVKKRGRRAK